MSLAKGAINVTTMVLPGATKNATNIRRINFGFLNKAKSNKVNNNLRQQLLSESGSVDNERWCDLPALMFSIDTVLPISNELPNSSAGLTEQFLWFELIFTNELDFLSVLTVL